MSSNGPPTDILTDTILLGREPNAKPEPWGGGPSLLSPFYFCLFLLPIDG
jgi:hypothetical protein